MSTLTCGEHKASNVRERKTCLHCMNHMAAAPDWRGSGWGQGTRFILSNQQVFLSFCASDDAELQCNRVTKQRWWISREHRSGFVTPDRRLQPRIQTFKHVRDQRSPVNLVYLVLFFSCWTLRRRQWSLWLAAMPNVNVPTCTYWEWVTVTRVWCNVCELICWFGHVK